MLWNLNIFYPFLFLEVRSELNFPCQLTHIGEREGKWRPSCFNFSSFWVLSFRFSYNVSSLSQALGRALSSFKVLKNIDECRQISALKETSDLKSSYFSYSSKKSHLMVLMNEMKHLELYEFDLRDLKLALNQVHRTGCSQASTDGEALCNRWRKSMLRLISLS